jgi:hypothetical protein
MSAEGCCILFFGLIAVAGSVLAVKAILVAFLQILGAI